MSEKWNSGHGGYICDTCSVLLWAGHNGSERSENRLYCYRLAGPEEVVQAGDKFFCSNECAESQNGDD